MDCDIVHLIRIDKRLAAVHPSVNWDTIVFVCTYIKTVATELTVKDQTWELNWFVPGECSFLWPSAKNIYERRYCPECLKLSRRLYDSVPCLAQASEKAFFFCFHKSLFFHLEWLIPSELDKNISCC